MNIDDLTPAATAVIRSTEEKSLVFRDRAELESRLRWKSNIDGTRENGGRGGGIVVKPLGDEHGSEWCVFSFERLAKIKS